MPALEGVAYEQHELDAAVLVGAAVEEPVTHMAFGFALGPCIVAGRNLAGSQGAHVQVLPDFGPLAGSQDMIRWQADTNLLKTIIGFLH